MKKIYCISLILLSMFCPALKSQSSLGIDSSNYSIPTTVSYNAVYTFSVNIKNYGPQVFIGTIDLIYAVDSSSTFPSYDTTSAHMVYGASIPVNGVQPDTNSIIIDARYKSGINTVVIWPKNDPNSNIITHDSLKVTILVTGTLNGITTYTENKPLVFPNPAQTSFFIANKDPQFTIEQVRIFDSSGQLVHSETFKGKIDIGKLAGGVYTLELSNKDGRLSRYKVIKE